MHPKAILNVLTTLIYIPRLQRYDQTPAMTSRRWGEGSMWRGRWRRWQTLSRNEEIHWRHIRPMRGNISHRTWNSKQNKTSRRTWQMQTSLPSGRSLQRRPPKLKLNQIEPDVGNTMECLVTRLGRNWYKICTFVRNMILRWLNYDTMYYDNSTDKMCIFVLLQ